MFNPARFRSVLSILAPLLATASLCGPAASAPALDTETAFVVHGGDRSLAAYGLPSGPLSLNVTSLGVFPNEVVVHGDRAWVVCSGSDEIHVVDLLTRTTLDTIPTGAGSNPYGIVVVSDARAYVTLLAANAVAPIDLVTGTLGTLIPVGRSPEGIAEADGRLFVTNSGFDFSTFGYDPGTVSVIDPVTNTVTHTLPVGLNPQGIDRAPDGRLHVVCTGNFFSVFGSAFVIDPAVPAVIDSLAIGGSPGFIAVSGSGIAWLSDYFLGLLAYDTASLAILHDDSNPVAVGTGAAGVDFDADGRGYVCVYGDDLLVILDPAGNPVDAIPMGDGPQDVVIHAAEEPVSVVLATFTGAVEADGVHLTWTTSDERNHAGFRVYRSSDAGNSWDERSHGLIVATGTPGLYEFVDAGAFAAGAVGSSILYRLGAVDRAGREEFAGTISVSQPARAKSFQLTAHPNPVRRSGTTFRFDGPAGAAPAGIAIFDLRGRKVLSLTAGPADGGILSIHWDGRGPAGAPLPAGVYFARIAAGGVTRTARVTIAP
jgi:YVTN family beta-propeller protein